MSARIGLAGAVLSLGGAAMMVAGGLISAPVGSPSAPWPGPGAFGMMGGSGAFGMMGGGGMMGGYGARSGPGPGEAGFTPGTQASPRVVRVIAGPGYTYRPSSITVARGETVTFQVTSMGGLVHEFMVGSADAVAADQPGTPEVADLGMMQTGSVTYTFDGSGPYAFACHVPGHYEAGMRGTITVVG